MVPVHELLSPRVDLEMTEGLQYWLRDEDCPWTPYGVSPDVLPGILTQGDLIYYAKTPRIVPELVAWDSGARQSPSLASHTSICNARRGQITASNSSPEPYQAPALSPWRMLYPPKTTILDQGLLLIMAARARARHVSPRKRKSCVERLQPRRPQWMKIPDPRNERESLARDAERGNRNVMAFLFVQTARMRKSNAFSLRLQSKSTTGKRCSRNIAAVPDSIKWSEPSSPRAHFIP
jgi:hypothetical protein